MTQRDPARHCDLDCPSFKVSYYDPDSYSGFGQPRCTKYDRLISRDGCMGPYKRCAACRRGELPRSDQP